jgi:hypothetical protein
VLLYSRSTMSPVRTTPAEANSAFEPTAASGVGSI